jgi:sigma-E factor negative regulatory protein RseC
MNNPTGRVLSLVDSPLGARAIVCVHDVPACPRCAAGKGCGAGLFAAKPGERRIEVTVPTGLTVAVDDEVEVCLTSDRILRAAAIVYGIPMLGALAGALIAYGAGFADEGAAATALAGLGIGLVISRRRLRQADCMQRFTPSIERLC